VDLVFFVVSKETYRQKNRERERDFLKLCSFLPHIQRLLSVFHLLFLVERCDRTQLSRCDYRRLGFFHTQGLSLEMATTGHHLYFPLKKTWHLFFRFFLLPLPWKYLIRNLSNVRFRSTMQQVTAVLDKISSYSIILVKYIKD
jgi:hypothetical protein